MATKYGTAKGETITGTASADTIYAKAGNDTLLGRAGGDRLLGEDGNDILRGEDGNDQLTGGFGDDLLDGGAGRDRVLYTGISAADAEGYGIRAYLAAGSVSTSTVGQDTLRGIEDIDGSQFRDDIVGNGLANLIGGGPGNDYLYGGGGTDKVYGGLGNDAVLGDDGNPNKPGDGDDRLYGGAGNDSLYGEGGRDLLFGESGNDHFAYRSGFAYDTDAPNNGTDYDFGSEVIMDFIKGQDKLNIVLISSYDDLFDVVEFEEFDTNNNSVLDAGDQKIDIKNVTIDGTTRLSTFIDVPEWDGDDSPASMITVFGVTGLRAPDFVSQADYDS